MENFKKNFTCPECEKEYMVLQKPTYDEMKKAKKCFECKIKLEPIRELKKESKIKIINYSYCCQQRQEIYERHIVSDCQACNKQRRTIGAFS
jgi:hypothetical protein